MYSRELDDLLNTLRMGARTWHAKDVVVSQILHAAAKQISANFPEVECSGCRFAVKTDDGYSCGWCEHNVPFFMEIPSVSCPATTRCKTFESK